MDCLSTVTWPTLYAASADKKVPKGLLMWLLKSVFKIPNSHQPLKFIGVQSVKYITKNSTPCIIIFSIEQYTLEVMNFCSYWRKHRVKDKDVKSRRILPMISETFKTIITLFMILHITWLALCNQSCQLLTLLYFFNQCLANLSALKKDTNNIKAKNIFFFNI